MPHDVHREWTWHGVTAGNGGFFPPENGPREARNGVLENDVLYIYIYIFIYIPLFSKGYSIFSDFMLVRRGVCKRVESLLPCQVVLGPYMIPLTQSKT